MKKKYLFLLLIIPVILLAEFFPMFFMKSTASGRIENSEIISARNKINSIFFIPTEKGWIAIDAGSSIKMAKEETKKLNIDTEKVYAVFLTHSDYDHVASIPLFKNAKIYLGINEKQMIDGNTKRSFMQKNRLPLKNQELIFLNDGEIQNTDGVIVKAIFTPGHTKGHMIYDVNGKYLFTGDAFKSLNGKFLIHPYTMNRKAASESIEKIREIIGNYEIVLTSHYGKVNFR